MIRPGILARAAVVRCLKVLAAGPPHHRQAGTQASKGRERTCVRSRAPGYRGAKRRDQLVVSESGRQRHLQVRPAWPYSERLAASDLKHVQFGFAHGAFQPQQQAIVESGRTYRPFLIQNERIGERAQLQQADASRRCYEPGRETSSPITRPALTEADLGHKLLKAVAPFIEAPEQPLVTVR